MCWKINKCDFNRKYNEKIKNIASTDIVVYKVGFKDSNNIFSPYFIPGFSYEPNKVNDVVELDFNENILQILSIEEGYHSYTEECTCYLKNNQLYIYINEKQQKYFADDYILSYGYCIGKFIIPKACEYYENIRGQIVSNNIVWTGEVMNIDNFIGKTFKFKYL